MDGDESPEQAGTGTIPAAPVLRVLTYNVRSLRDDKHAVARVIADQQPHVVCVQEAPRFLRWRSKCAALARESGLVVVTGGRTAGAMLLLCALSVDVEARYDVLLARKPGLHQRGLAVGVLRYRGVRFAVASMHLDLDPAERRRHVDEVFGRLDRLAPGVPLILAGDVNEEPGDPAWAAIESRLVDAYAAAPAGPAETFSAANPHKRIDAVFTDPRLPVVACRAVEHPEAVAASDHRPVLAELRLTPTGP